MAFPRGFEPPAFPIGGMTIGTVVTLFLIPSVYCIFYKIDFKEKEEIQNDSNNSHE